MLHFRLLLALFALVFTFTSPSLMAAEKINPSTAKPDEKSEVFFYDIRPLGLEGQGWTDVAAPYDRLPASAEKLVRPVVWSLSHNSAGMCVRFVTDATEISARWTVKGDKLAMPHMAATGVSGVDLYTRLDNGRWRWLAVGKPAEKTNTVKLTGPMPVGTREFMLYLPLYNDVASAEIGIPKGATLFKAPPRPAEKAKPILFYGTSITHGACASRPGMCHPAILGRRFDWPVINLGFSGNGMMEPEIADLLATLDPAVYVIDCLPNMEAPLVTERAGNLVRRLRNAHPDTPILLVEDRTFADAFLIENKRKRTTDSRAALKKVYEELIAAGVKNLSYLPGDKLLGEDGEDTVDGSHPTDLGFYRQADAFQPLLEPLLRKR